MWYTTETAPDGSFYPMIVIDTVKYVNKAVSYADETIAIEVCARDYEGFLVAMKENLRKNGYESSAN